MGGVSVRACLRCHEKKIRCTGYPSCRHCRQSEVDCVPYTRPRKSDSLQAVKKAESRTRWLENEVSRELGIDLRAVPTDTPLPNLRPQHDGGSHGSSLAAPRDRRSSMSGSVDVPGSAATSLGGLPVGNDDNAAESSLLAFNATGELRYLGPSSGTLFANHAIALVRSSAPDPGTCRRPLEHAGVIREASTGIDKEQRPLLPEEVRLLLQSYKMWVHPLYPLLDLESLDGLVSRCRTLQTSSGAQSQGQEMSIFYLVMALGATNHANTAKQLRLDSSNAGLSDGAASPTYLYSAASRYLLLGVEHLRPSVSFIQIILLACICSSYGPIGSSQWQLAGLAMRTAIEIGLHYAPKGRQAYAVDMDTRSRVFWTAYAIEISLAYNLGRPPSISQEHITAPVPIVDSRDESLGVHHVKHRQIQSRVVSHVYYGSHRENGLSWEDRQTVIANLQSELDDWKLALENICSGNTAAPYPLSYWERLYNGTTFVLHRASPLCPHPAEESLERCIRSAGAYIDNVGDLLKASNVPLSWMLVQGVLFAGLTMLVTARTSYRRLAPRTGLPFLLVELPAWSRKCSVCLAIMNERWSEDLLSELDSQFELLADDTLGVISTGLTCQAAPRTVHHRDEAALAPRSLDQQAGSVTTGQYTGGPPGSGESEIADPIGLGLSKFPDIDMAESWENLDLFREVLGIDGSQTFWDIFALETDIGSQGQTMLMN